MQWCCFCSVGKPSPQRCLPRLTARRFKEQSIQGSEGLPPTPCQHHLARRVSSKPEGSSPASGQQYADTAGGYSVHQDEEEDKLEVDTKRQVRGGSAPASAGQRRKRTWQVRRRGRRAKPFSTQPQPLQSAAGGPSLTHFQQGLSESQLNAEHSTQAWTTPKPFGAI